MVSLNSIHMNEYTWQQERESYRKIVSKIGFKKWSKALIQLRCQPEKVVNLIQIRSLTDWFGVVYVFICFCFLIRWTSKLCRNIVCTSRLCCTLWISSASNGNVYFLLTAAFVAGVHPNEKKNKHTWQSHWAKGWNNKKCKEIPNESNVWSYNQKQKKKKEKKNELQPARNEEPCEIERKRERLCRRSSIQRVRCKKSASINSIKQEWQQHTARAYETMRISLLKYESLCKNALGIMFFLFCCYFTLNSQI